MAYEERNNSGSLFKNDRKQNDRQPDYHGNCVVNGQAMRVSAWVKTSRNGTKFMSLAFDAPMQQQGAPQGGYAPAPAPAQPAPKPQYAPASPAPASQDNDNPNEDLPFPMRPGYVSKLP